MSYFKVRLPGGVLKVKPRRQLRRRERDHEVPTLRLGPFYLIWWPNDADKPLDAGRTTPPTP